MSVRMASSVVAVFISVVTCVLAASESAESDQRRTQIIRRHFQESSLESLEVAANGLSKKAGTPTPDLAAKAAPAAVAKVNAALQPAHSVANGAAATSPEAATVTSRSQDDGGEVSPSPSVSPSPVATSPSPADMAITGALEAVGEDDGDGDGDDGEGDDDGDGDGALGEGEDDGAGVPAPAKKEPETEYTVPSPSPWDPSPSPPPAPVSLEDFLGPPSFSPSPVPPQPLDPSICKAVAGIMVEDVRDIHHMNATVSHKRNGEKQHCGVANVLHLGTFPNGRLKACAMSVASNASCSNEFQLEKETYACDCVQSWSFCHKAEQNETCIYDLNPGAGLVETSTDTQADLAGIHLR